MADLLGTIATACRRRLRDGRYSAIFSDRNSGTSPCLRPIARAGVCGDLPAL
ncbi:hypothetical protein HMPREF3150_01569 [Pseudomonas aeruginosa]|nr:hypothetical protein HMPREF3150_01569 [Pseudomonas aeruginosa]